MGWENYEELLLYDEVFWQTLANMLIWIGAAPVAILLALGIALLVNCDLRGAGVYRTIVFLSYPLMTVAVGIIWRWMYDERGGLLNWALRSAGVIDRPLGFLGSFDLTLPSVLLTDVWQVIGFYMIVLLTGLGALLVHHPADAAAVAVPVRGDRVAELLHLVRPLTNSPYFRWRCDSLDSSAFRRSFGSWQVGAWTWASQTVRACGSARCGGLSAGCMGLTCMPSGSMRWPGRRWAS